MNKLRYPRNAERPAVEMWLRDDDSTLIDMSGYTFTLKVGDLGATALLTKTAGIVGAAGSGTEPTGTPNVTVTWATGELNLTPGTYSWNLTATTGGLDRGFRGTITIDDTIQ